MNKEVILLNIRKKLDVIDSFVAGFGNRNNVDINNAIFIAKELLGLNLPLDFRGGGRLGVESLELYGILEDVEPDQKNSDAFQAGRTLSDYSSCELMLMALYLWNEGKSSLRKNERKEARILLQKFDVTIRKEQITRSSTAMVSG